MTENKRYATYDVVPEGFDLLGAPFEKLDEYGIPRRPDADAEPRLFDFWKKLVSAPFVSRRPTFSPSTTEMTTMAYHSGSKRTVAPSPGGAVESNLNWSGGLVSPPFPKRIVLVVGGWTVPEVTPASLPALDSVADDPRALVWVGLDGHNGQLPKISLPQIGTGHTPGQPHFAWWFWWKNGLNQPVTKITNFPIRVGDEILAGLAVMASEDVLYFIKNQTTGEFRSFLGRRQPLGDIERLGSSAEWVVERPTDPASRVRHAMPAYTPVEFKYCMALAANLSSGPGRLVTFGNNGRMIKMREAFASPYRTRYVSRAKRRHDLDGSIGVTCTFHDPA